MNKIEEIDEKSRTITLQSGVIVEDAINAVNEKDLLLPLNFGAKGSAQIGGVVSTNAGGLRVLKYGMTRGLVLGLEAVLSNGEVISSMKKVIKDNSGIIFRVNEDKICLFIYKNVSTNFNLNSNNIHMTFNYSLLNNLLPSNAELNRSSYETNVPEDIKYTWDRDNQRQVHNLRYSFVYDFSEKTEAGFSITGYSNPLIPINFWKYFFIGFAIRLSS